MPMLGDLLPTWDLETIFPGGTASDEFATFLTRLEADAMAFALQ